MHSETFKCGWMYLIGFVLKLYDDLDDLYMIKNERFMSCLQTLLTLLLCYWLFVLAKNKYEVQIILAGTLSALFDWKEWTSDPYFFSVTVVMTVVAVAQLIHTIYQEHGIPSMNHTLLEWVNWIHAIGYRVIVLMMCVFGFTLIQTIPEAFCVEFNGVFYEMAKWLHWVPPHTDGMTLVTLTKTEREVSVYKLTCRAFHVLYLLVCLCIWSYLRYLCYHTSLYPIFTALSYINLMMMGYFSLSVCNQLYVLYLRPDIIEVHDKKNNPTDPIGSPQEQLPDTISLNLPYSLFMSPPPPITGASLSRQHPPLKKMNMEIVLKSQMDDHETKRTKEEEEEDKCDSRNILGYR
jgi:hypothetical protein